MKKRSSRRAHQDEPELTGTTRNLIPSKEFFFFGSDSFEPKALSAYLKGEKNTENAHHNISWASHTGNGLLFIGDKKAPTSIINLVRFLFSEAVKYGIC